MSSMVQDIIRCHTLSVVWLATKWPRTSMTYKMILNLQTQQSWNKFRVVQKTSIFKNSRGSLSTSFNHEKYVWIEGKSLMSRFKNKSESSLVSPII